MGKKFSGVSQTMSRFRGWIQAGATLLTNLHLPNFLKGGLYQGAGKTVCVPGLNCYSCPAASGACPIGAFQAVVGSSKFSFSYYITGFLILLGVLLGRFICGFLCPFGWFQELLHKIPTKKLSTKKLKPLTYLKYAVLLVMVFLLPAFLVNDVGMGDPFFCKYLCPQGVLEGAIPLSLANAGIRAALGKLFTWKFSILLSVIVLSVLFYRPFCKWLCPLGAFYALFNRVSLFQMKVDSAIFNHAVRYYNLRDNPCKKAGSMGKKKNREMMFWTKEQYLKFAEVMMDKPLSFYAFEMLYWCGIREGELLALTPADFDFEKRTVTINKSYQRLNGQDLITTPKTEKSNRVITMPQFLAEEIQDYLKMLYGIGADDRMFTVTKSYLHREMDRGSKEAGVPRIRIHDIRHSAVSLLIDMGFSATAIADRVGHESIDITYNYAHLFPSKQTEMADKLNMERGN